MIQRERHNFRVFREDGVNRPAQMADAFPVDDTYLQNSTFLARLQIIGDELLNVAWVELVQVQHAVYGKLNWVVHIEARLSISPSPA